jgi:general secretion pathway protein F
MQALHAQSGQFSALLVGLVQAAEQTSELPRALGRYLLYRERVDGLRHRLGSALVYPCVLAAVGLGVCLFLLGYVVPRFASVVQDSPQLPWASAQLMALGQWVGQHTAWLLPTLGLGAALAGRQAWRAWHHGEGLQWLARLPGAARHWHSLSMARLYLTVGLLLDGGIPMQAALSLAEPVLPPARRAALAQARECIAQGQALSSSLQQAGLSTAVADRLIRVGEHSGQLGALLARAAAFHDDEAARWIERFSKAFEPTLMAAIGLVVGLIVVLLYLPIFDLAGSLG